jgi:hypothetical protein
MARFEVLLERTETWLADVVIEADSPEEARERVEHALSDGGWDSVCDDEGTYEECLSEVTEVRPCAAGDVNRLPVPLESLEAV